MIESDIPSSQLMTAAIGFAVIVTTICPVLATMLLDSAVNCVEPEVDVLGGISNDSSKPFVRQRLITIRCQNRFLGFFQ